MKRPTTKRPLTPAEERRLLSGVPLEEEETAGVKRRRGKVGVRESEARRVREEAAVSRLCDDDNERR